MRQLEEHLGRRYLGLDKHAQHQLEYGSYYGWLPARRYMARTKTGSGAETNTRPVMRAPKNLLPPTEMVIENIAVVQRVLSQLDKVMMKPYTSTSHCARSMGLQSFSRVSTIGAFGFGSLGMS
jgi:hypothetical protein